MTAVLDIIFNGFPEIILPSLMHISSLGGYDIRYFSSKGATLFYHPFNETTCALPEMVDFIKIIRGNYLKRLMKLWELEPFKLSPKSLIAFSNLFKLEGTYKKRSCWHKNIIKQ